MIWWGYCENSRSRSVFEAIVPDMLQELQVVKANIIAEVGLKKHSCHNNRTEEIDEVLYG